MKKKKQNLLRAWQVHMLEFRRELSTLEVPEKRLTVTLDKILGQVIREAARRWLRKFILHVPTETGMARAALRPLGQFLRLAVPIRPTRKPYYSQLEGSEQSIAAGEANNFWYIADSDIYEFQWSTNILHYYLSQYYNGKAIPGEDVMEIAEAAFTDHVYNTLGKRVAKSLEGLIQIREI